MKSDAVENRTEVYNWFRSNPGGRGDMCAKSLGLSETTVSKHRRAIADGWRPAGRWTGDMEGMTLADVSRYLMRGKSSNCGDDDTAIGGDDA